MCSEAHGCNFVVWFHERGYLARINTLGTEGVCSHAAAEEAMTTLIRPCLNFRPWLVEEWLGHYFGVDVREQWIVIEQRISEWEGETVEL
jgi:hypothetical protein